jgi:2-iminobutanoate/2-iminopropanoate deaminase
LKPISISIPALETGAPYSLCLRHENLVYISGLPPFDEEFSKELREARVEKKPTPPFPDLSFEQQVRIVMRNLKALLEAADSGLDCLLKVTVWLADQSNSLAFDAIYRTYFEAADVLPTRTRIQAGRLPMDCAVEIEAVGYVKGN